MMKWTNAFVLILWCVTSLSWGSPQDSGPAQRLALKDGSVLVIDRFVQRESVVEVWIAGTLYSIPLKRVDLDKTALLNQEEAAQHEKEKNARPPRRDLQGPGPVPPRERQRAGEGDAQPITNQTLKRLYEGQGDWVPGITSDKPPQDRIRKPPPLRPEVPPDDERAKGLESIKSEMAAVADKIEATASKLKELQSEHRVETRLIEFVLTNGGSPESVGGNVVKRAALETRIKDMAKELEGLSERYRKLQQELRWASGPSVR